MTHKRFYPKIKKQQIYQGIRHTHSTTKGLEDLIALQIASLRALQRSMLMLQNAYDETCYINEKIEKAINTLYVVRKGPYAYPNDDDIVAIKISGNGRKSVIKPHHGQ